MSFITGLGRQVVIGVCVGLLLLVAGCEQSAQGAWITGTEQEKLEQIEDQFRGFDLAMVETGYRYQELYWAGEDGNWEYAEYQLEKIEKAIENGLRRRPKRAASAQPFLSKSLPAMQAAVKGRSEEAFSTEFKSLTQSCNECHARESVPFFTVEPPQHRQSPISR